MDVSTSTLAAAVQGVRALISAYEGYEKGRFMESDEAVRAEIQRRCEMLSPVSYTHLTLPTKRIV